MSSPAVAGIRPWYPWPLSRWRWWTEPVAGERLAALRIGLSAVLLVDVLCTYVPHVFDFFGPNHLGGPTWTSALWTPEHRYWSILHELDNPDLLLPAMLIWILAILTLLVGFFTRVSAAVVWVLSVSFARLNPNIDNAGDTIRTIGLFYLMLSPCGTVWSVDARRRGPDAPRLVYPWPLRLLFVQLIFIYFCNGVHKAVGKDWPEGKSLYYVLGDLTLARWSYAQVTVPYWITRALTWLVLGWEVLFPLLIIWRPIRIVALCFGAAFHLGIWVNMELGGFAPYALCLYLPLLPWERWIMRRQTHSES
jgi:hypothetical protein